MPPTTHYTYTTLQHAVVVHVKRTLNLEFLYDPSARPDRHVRRHGTQLVRCCACPCARRVVLRTHVATRTTDLRAARCGQVVPCTRTQPL